MPQVIIDLLNWLGVTQDKHIASAIGGLFGFTGVVFTGFAAVAAWIGRHSWLRREKRRDLRYALLAEIRVQWRALYMSRNSEKLIGEIEKRLKARGGRDYSPFFSKYLGVDIYQEVISDITALGDKEIPYIVDFYHQMAVINNFVDELSRDSFTTFPAERKLTMIAHLFVMINRAIELAEDAQVVLEQLLKMPRRSTIDYIKQQMPEDENSEN